MKKEIAVFKIVKFTAIITLNESYREEKVDRNIALKIWKKRVNIGFVAERKGPYEVSKIITR